jgi:hypothetical protein
MLFDRLGIAPSQTVPADLNRLKDRLMSELQGLSKRQLTVVIYFSASLGIALLGLVVVTRSISLGDLAQAYCARLHRYLRGQHESLDTGYRPFQDQSPLPSVQRYLRTLPQNTLAGVLSSGLP